MKVLVLYDYPPSPSGLATQGDLLYRGLLESGVDVHAVHLESSLEKEWYYRWFKPDIAVGIGYWGYTPNLILHPLSFGIQPVPWLVADGYIANYQEILNSLPLILVTSNWVKEMYVRDGISEDKLEVLPVGCPTDSFIPLEKTNPKVAEVRNAFGIHPDELMILTLGGDVASKGAREVMQALALIDKEVPSWRYICKVWPQERTTIQNRLDLELAISLGIEKKITYATNITSRAFMPFLLSACDIYAAPSRLEGFGMPQVEAGACGKPVISINAMGLLDTMVHGKTAYLAKVAEQIVVNEVSIKIEGDTEPRKVIFNSPRTVDYRADVNDISKYLLQLMHDSSLRDQMGQAGRKRAVELFDYHVVAKRFIRIIEERLGIH